MPEKNSNLFYTHLLCLKTAYLIANNVVNRAFSFAFYAWIAIELAKNMSQRDHMRIVFAG